MIQPGPALQTMDSQPAHKSWAIQSYAAPSGATWRSYLRSYTVTKWVTLHPIELRCMYWAKLHPRELCGTLLICAVSFWAMLVFFWAKLHHIELHCTLLYYVAHSELRCSLYWAGGGGGGVLLTYAEPPWAMSLSMEPRCTLVSCNAPLWAMLHLFELRCIQCVTVHHIEHLLS
jgi:hypothetical protein